MTKLCEQCNGRKAHHPSLACSRFQPARRPHPEHPAGSLATNEDVRGVAIQIRRARHARGFSQTALADAAGISRASVNAIESGAADPRVSTVCALARALGVAPAELLSSCSVLSAGTRRA